MEQRIDAAQREVARARENALRSGDSRLKQDWLTAADKWEDLIAEYRALENLRDSA